MKSKGAQELCGRKYSLKPLMQSLDKEAITVRFIISKIKQGYINTHSSTIQKSQGRNPKKMSMDR